MQSMQARIRQLEAENGSLAAAADEAAAVAEEYAADAAKYRAEKNNSQTALVNELTDATRRKDRRIQRLTAMLEAEKVRAEDAEQRVVDLEKRNRTLNDDASTALQSSRVPEREADVMSAIQEIYELSQRALHSLECMLPERLRGAAPAFRVLFSALLARKTALLITSKRQDKSNSHDFVKLSDQIAEIVRRAIVWCFLSPLELSDRGASLKQPITALAKRMDALYSELAEGDSHLWTTEYANMKENLVVMAIENVKSIVPSSMAVPYAIEDINFEEICEKLANSVTEDTSSAEVKSRAGIVEDLESKLEAAKLVLRQRTKELEDMRVRNSVFDERLKTLGKDKHKIPDMEATIRTLQEKLAEMEVLMQKSTQTDAVNEAATDDAENENRSNEVLETPSKQETPCARSDRMNENMRLRRMLVHSHLADLQTAKFEDAANGQYLEKAIALRKTVSNSLRDARHAASMARVVRLDPDSLQPRTDGTTMSRKGILQSAAALRESISSTKLDSIEEKFVDRNEIRLYPQEECKASVIKFFRKAVAS